MLTFPAHEYDYDSTSATSIWFVDAAEAERRLDEVLALEDTATDRLAQAAVDQVLLEQRPDLRASPVPAAERVESPWADAPEAAPPGLSRRELAKHWFDETLPQCSAASDRMVARLGGAR